VSSDPSSREQRELVQCPNCLGYFTQNPEGDYDYTEKSFERHVCYIGGRRARPEG
jgi:hypothetical protein